VLKIPVIRGRDFTDRNTAGAPGVVIINQEMARRFWPAGDPLNDRVIGIRTALGADAYSVRNMVLRQGMTLAALGILVGIGSSRSLARVLAGFLFGVAPRDPAVFTMARSCWRASRSSRCGCPPGAPPDSTPRPRCVRSDRGDGPRRSQGDRVGVVFGSCRC
jgi:hypothetical protein